MRMRDLVSFIAFAAMIAVGAAYISSLGVRIEPPSRRTNVSMTVGDVNGLVVDSNVLLRGVPVGKVTKIGASVDGATIDFYIDDRFQIPIDCDVRLANLSALGETYIGLVPQSQAGPMLYDGQRIAAESIMEPPSVSELAKSIVRVLNQLDPGALERITDEADIALPDANSVLPSLSHASRLLRNTATGMRGRGRELLDNFQTLLQGAGWLGPKVAELTPLIQELSPEMRGMFSGLPVIAARGGPENLYKFGRFLGRIQNLLDTRGGDLKVIGEELSPHIKGIAGALLNFDPAQILGNILASMPEDGAITLHVNIPAP